MANRSNPLVAPSTTFANLVGEGVAYNGRASFRHFGWLPKSDIASDARAGHVLTVAGDLPALCPAPCATPACWELLERAGIEQLPELLIYHDEAEYRGWLDKLADEGRRVVFQHLHPPGEIVDSLYRIPPGVVGWLNDKASLSELVPTPYVPPRKVVPADELERFLPSDFSRPVVLKASAPMDSGAGHAVAILRDPTDVPAARERLGDAQRFVLEQFLEVERNYCLGFAASDETVFMTGVTEQIVDPSGCYLGNWVDADLTAPAEAIEVGLEIMRRAAARGYVGIAGFDMVVDRDGRLWVIDLNFRLNGSTPINLWQSTLCSRWTPWRTAKMVQWSVEVPLAKVSRRIGELIDQRRFFPLRGFDPLGCDYPAPKSSMLGILFGQSREEVERVFAAFESTLPGTQAAPGGTQAAPGGDRLNETGKRRAA